MRQIFGSALGTIIAIIIIILCLCSCCFFAAVSFSSSLTGGTSADGFTYESGNSVSENKVLTIKIDGVILAERSESDPLGILGLDPYIYGYEIKDQLVRAADDATIKGVILEFNSPGGSPVGAQAIANGVQYYREQTQKPIISYISEQGASGAYWSAASTDLIVVEPNGLVGSIGVLSGPFQYYDKLIGEGDILTQNGIESYYITSGKSKDFGSPYRRLTEEERNQWQATVNSTYDRFVQFVSQNRAIDEARIRDVIGAYLYDTTKAMEFGLIDRTGNKDDAYAELLVRAGLNRGDYQVVKQPKDADFFSTLLGAVSSTKLENYTKACPLYAGPMAIVGDIEQYCG